MLGVCGREVVCYGESRNHLDFSRQPERLQAYLDGLTQAVWHKDRAVPIENYSKTLSLPIERKNVEPTAAMRGARPRHLRQRHLIGIGQLPKKSRRFPPLSV